MKSTAVLALALSLTLAACGKKDAAKDASTETCDDAFFTEYNEAFRVAEVAGTVSRALEGVDLLENLRGRYAGVKCDAVERVSRREVVIDIDAETATELAKLRAEIARTLVGEDAGRAASDPAVAELCLREATDRYAAMIQAARDAGRDDAKLGRVKSDQIPALKSWAGKLTCIVPSGPYGARAERALSERADHLLAAMGRVINRFGPQNPLQVPACDVAGFGADQDALIYPAYGFATPDEIAKARAYATGLWRKYAGQKCWVALALTSYRDLDAQAEISDLALKLGTQ